MKRKHISLIFLIAFLIVAVATVAAGFIENRPEPVPVEKEIKYEKQ